MPAIPGGKIRGSGWREPGRLVYRRAVAGGGAREVVLLDNLSLGSMETMQPMLADGRCSFVRGDILRLNELFEPLEDADGVFAVAGIMATTIRENPWMSLDVNIRGFQNALEACRLQGVKKVVLQFFRRCLRRASGRFDR